MEIQPFPDYDRLLERAKSYEGPPIDSQVFSQHIACIGAQGKIKASPMLSGITALIIHHSLLHNKLIGNKIPYGGMSCSGGNGIVFSLSNNFDPVLQLIIYIYIHTQCVLKK